MKANWKIALMCVAAIAMIACDKKNHNNDDPDDPSGNFVSKVSVTDNSIAEWENLPAEFVVSTVCPEDALQTALKSAKVYADKVYINILVEFDPEDITEREWTPFHVYLNTDNSDATGGYSDQFLDPNADVLLETAVFCQGAAYDYNPGVFRWWGEVGGEGWNWTEYPSDYYTDGDGLNWGSIVAEGSAPIGHSQIIDGKYIEIQLLRELIPSPIAGWNADAFGIGFDIQQNWSSVGVLPIGEPDENNAAGWASKLQVRIDK